MTTPLQQAAEALMEVLQDKAEQTRAKEQRLLDALTRPAAKNAPPKLPGDAPKGPR